MSTVLSSTNARLGEADATCTRVCEARRGGCDAACETSAVARQANAIAAPRRVDRAVVAVGRDGGGVLSRQSGTDAKLRV